MIQALQNEIIAIERKRPLGTQHSLAVFLISGYFLLVGASKLAFVALICIIQSA